MDHKTSTKTNAFFWVWAFGIFLSFLGLFFPWGTEVWPEGIMNIATGYVFGFEDLIGSFALVGCSVAAISWAQNIRRSEHSLGFAFAGESVVAFFSLLWIVNSRNLPWLWGWYGGPSLSWVQPAYWSPMYGPYISLIGALIALTTELVWPALDGSFHQKTLEKQKCTSLA